MGSSRSHKKTHLQRHSSPSGDSVKDTRHRHRHSRDCSFPDTDVKLSGHKSKDSGNVNNRVALRKIVKRVYHMVDEDRQRSSTAQKHENEKVQSLVPDCGCPNNCGPELQKLREYIANLHPSLVNSSVNMYELDQLVDTPERLLSEAWITTGASKLRELMPEDLLAICSRREKRGSKHPSGSYYANTLSVANSLPPFTSFCESQSQPDCGITEFWRRCLFELFELSPSEIKLVLSGVGDLSSINPPHYELKNERQLNLGNQSTEAPCESSFISYSNVVHPPTESPESVNCSYVNQSAKTVSTEPRSASGHSEECSPPQQSHVRKEIVELEMRARAIRSMLGSRRNS
ncbi:unnamed protein product [Dicrocoelium dendriticum]|nr:unnamed protein product [Dicrocoelium dendriticum]